MIETLVRSKYVTVPKFSDLTGYSASAVRKKLYSGVWVEGIHYRHAPDRKILINTEAYAQWVEGRSALDIQAAARES